MKKIAFITGINGQDGSYLAEFLLEKGYEVWGMIRRASTINTGRIDHIYEKINLRYGDITDKTSIYRILNEIKEQNPEILEFYNFAAMSHVKVLFDEPEYSGQANGIGVLNCLETILQFSKQFKIKFYQASTSELFGNSHQIQNEMTPFSPCSPYSTAKLYGYWITKNYRESYGLFACNGIAFNHESPRRGPTFVTRKITLALNNISNGTQKNLVLGNINSYRDWGHAKDYVKAMWMMLQNEKPDDYVIATGECHTVKEFVEEAFKIKNINITWNAEGKGVDQNGRILIDIDKKYFRPNDVEYLCGDASKIKENLKWKSEITFEELVREMVESDYQKHV